MASILAGLLLVCACATASDLSAFSSDGCSLFPDGTPGDREQWCDCCFNHDLAYWRGGSEEERKQADMALRLCVLDRSGDQTLAKMMYDGVRVGGSPVFPSWYRWGYGWEYGRGYRPLTSKEQTRVANMLAAYHQSHPSGYCRKR